MGEKDSQDAKKLGDKMMEGSILMPGEKPKMLIVPEKDDAIQDDDNKFIADSETVKKRDKKLKK